MQGQFALHRLTQTGLVRAQGPYRTIYGVYTGLVVHTKQSGARRTLILQIKLTAAETWIVLPSILMRSSASRLSQLYQPPPLQFTYAHVTRGNDYGSQWPLSASPLRPPMIQPARRSYSKTTNITRYKTAYGRGAERPCITVPSDPIHSIGFGISASPDRASPDRADADIPYRSFCTGPYPSIWYLPTVGILVLSYCRYGIRPHAMSVLTIVLAAQTTTLLHCGTTSWDP